MAIDFPTSPINGQTYDFGGIRYTFDNTGGAPGHWRIFEAGLQGPASVAEINAGIVATKFCAPDGLAASEYMREFEITSNEAGSNVFPGGTPLDITGGAGLTVSQDAVGWKLNPVPATTSATGVTILNDTVTSTSDTEAATASAAKAAYDAGADSTQSVTAFDAPSARGSTSLWDALSGVPTNGTGVILQFGSAAMGGVASGSMVFDTPFHGNPYSIVLGHINAGVVYPLLNVKAVSSTGFDWQMGWATSGNYNGTITYIAIGAAVGVI